MSSCTSSPSDTSIETIKALFYKQIKNVTQRSSTFDIQYSDSYQNFEF